MKQRVSIWYNRVSCISFIYEITYIAQKYISYRVWFFLTLFFYIFKTTTYNIDFEDAGVIRTRYFYIKGVGHI